MLPLRLVRPSLHLLGRPLNSSQFAAFCSQNINHELDTLYKKLELECRAHDPAVLESYKKFVHLTAQELGVPHVKTWNPWVKIMRRPLLRSIHIYKDAREFYEFRTYFLMMEFKNMTGSTLDTFLEYIERNLPEAVSMRATKTELATLPSHLNPKEANPSP